MQNRPTSVLRLGEQCVNRLCSPDYYQEDLHNLRCFLAMKDVVFTLVAHPSSASNASPEGSESDAVHDINEVDLIAMIGDCDDEISSYPPTPTRPSFDPADEISDYPPTPTHPSPDTRTPTKRKSSSGKLSKKRESSRSPPYNLEDAKRLKDGDLYYSQ